MTFAEKLSRAVEKNNSLLCVGLDSDGSKLPAGQNQLSFNKAIVDATHDLVCAYKPNTAFYEALGSEGIETLKATCDYINEQYPELPIILDAKRADIGNTNGGYVSFAYEYLGADAITLHPYLGGEALEPFLEIEDKGAVILCRNSNPGAGEFQDLTVEGKPIYEKVAHAVKDSWNARGNCLLVVGATYPDEAAKVRDIVGEDMWLLIPGVGAQGADVEATVRAAQNSHGEGMIINSSRGIIFASSGDDFAEVARKEAKKLRDEINAYRRKR
ncbi:orotidine-5'-phosphate decarboxylase [Candidatus Saccharibacteria bacterium]|nr:orotidine-5'-phosphate decarboxylase [Candidatus Saccharibacteria bacterium]